MDKSSTSNEFINQHKQFHTRIKEELDDFIQPLDIPFPLFFNDHRELKEQDHLKSELAKVLPWEFDVINDKEMIMEKTHKQLD